MAGSAGVVMPPSKGSARNEFKVTYCRRRFWREARFPATAHCARHLLSGRWPGFGSARLPSRAAALGDRREGSGRQPVEGEEGPDSDRPEWVRFRSGSYPANSREAASLGTLTLDQAIVASARTRRALRNEDHGRAAWRRSAVYAGPRLVGEATSYTAGRSMQWSWNRSRSIRTWAPPTSTARCSPSARSK